MSPPCSACARTGKRHCFCWKRPEEKFTRSIGIPVTESLREKVWAAYELAKAHDEPYTGSLSEWLRDWIGGMADCVIGEYEQAHRKGGTP